MNERLRAQVSAELDALRAANTYKTFLTLRSPQGPVVDMEGRGEVIVLSSNNYLGLAAHPAVIEATESTGSSATEPARPRCGSSAGRSSPTSSSRPSWPSSSEPRLR